MIVGFELGKNWEGIAMKAKRIDLVIAGLVVVVILAIVVRFVIRRRRERAGGMESEQKNPEAAAD